MNIHLCITTMNDNIYYTIEKFYQYISPKVFIHISHQITNGKKYDIQNKHIQYYFLEGKGLSHNRNNILKNLTDGIGVICDDDISLHKDFAENIIQAYKKHPQAGAITFQTMTHEGEKRKNYQVNEYKHNSISLLSISSIEITYDIKKVKKHTISFNEEFGLGSTIPFGEENLFLKEIYDAGEDIYYTPKILSIHPLESSGDTYSIRKKRKFIKKYDNNIIFQIGSISYLAIKKYYLLLRKYFLRNCETKE